MTNYIRKGVELADGWDIDEFWIYSSDYDYKHNTDFPLSDIFKDALAAQLVRQVDALDSKFIFVNGLGDVSIHSNKFDIDPNPFYAKGDDRTMNTIKAIVDSGVLK